MQLQQVTDNLGMHGAAKGGAYFAFGLYEGLYLNTDIYDKSIRTESELKFMYPRGCVP